MRLLVQFFVVATVLLVGATSREYHYNRPVLPFYSGNAANSAQSQPLQYAPPTAQTPIVVRTLGPTARDYEVYGVTNSKQIFLGTQSAVAAATPVTAAVTSQYAQPTNVAVPPQSVTYQAYQAQTAVQYQPATQFSNAAQYAPTAQSASIPQNAPTVQYAPAAQSASIAQNAPTAQYVPIAQLAPAAQFSAAVNLNSAPQPYQQTGNIFGQHIAATYPQAPASSHASNQQHATNYNVAQQNSFATSQQNGAQYGNTATQTTGVNQQHATNYNVAQQNGFAFPSATPQQQGAQFANTAVQTAGNAAHFNPSTVAGKIGDYVAQSQVGQLDHYTYKQLDGDARPYKRIITTCVPGTPCETKTINAGASDARHQHVVVAARARVASVSDKCQRQAGETSGIIGVAANGAASFAVNTPKNAAGYANAASANLANNGNVVNAANVATTAHSATRSGFVPAATAGFPNTAGQIRPRDRRLSSYTEQLIRQDPYN